MTEEFCESSCCMAHRTFERVLLTVFSGGPARVLLADGTLVRFFSVVRPEMRLER